MAQLKNVQAKIFKIEEFEVKFKDRKSKKYIPPNKQGIPGYPYQKKLKNTCSVAHWRRIRFKACYPGFGVDVYNADGSVASGKLHLGTVRDTYLEEQ